MINIMTSDQPIFVLHTDNTTYAFRVLASGQLEHLHYGRRIRIGAEKEGTGLEEQHDFPPGNTNIYAKDAAEYSLEDMRLEFSAYGKGDIREPMLEAVYEDGSSTMDFVYEGYSLRKGKEGELSAGKGYGLEEMKLPASYGSEKEAEGITIRLKERNGGLRLYLNYDVFAKEDAICRSVCVENPTDRPVRILRLLSMSFDFDRPARPMIFSTFQGAWAREMKKNDHKILPGKISVSSFTGTSSSRANPFVMISEEKTTEESGACYGFNLVYSGNHYEAVEVSSHGKIRFVSGINPIGFSWKLESGESLQSPEAVMVFSADGFGGMSRKMHAFVNDRIVRGYWKRRERPILLNSWEAAYFDINESKLLKLAKEAADVGIELFVMDDGWFGKRNDDTSSLGDWKSNPKKLPGGVKGMAEKVKRLGLDFGIWIEPEMISEDSDLYREHPDWAMRIPDKEHSVGRNQMLLDASRKEVVDDIITQIDELLTSAPISYVKWDMNRTMTDIYSAVLPKDRQAETAHRYMLGVYRVMRTLTQKHPKVLFEGCAAGGNRFDLGMLCYFPQIWASDDTDAICRAEIQTGYSYAYPQSTYTAHVSDVPNHQTLRRTPLETRFQTAAFAVLGYECNLSDMDAKEKGAIAAQVEEYKKWRRVLQFGSFYRIRGFADADGMSALFPLAGNDVEWCVVSEDGSKAVSYLLQTLVHPNIQTEVLHPAGLKDEALYRISGREIAFDLKDFGGLVNYVAPFHVKQDGAVHNVLSHFVPMNAEKETHRMYGSAIKYAGIHLKSAFSSAGYRENMRFYPDFASRMYYIKEIRRTNS